MRKINSLDTLPVIKNALLDIANTLNSRNITWGLGGSLLLFIKGYKTNVNDIDIIVHSKDLMDLKEVISKYEINEKEKTAKFLTNHFYTFNIKSINIDIMVGFVVKNEFNIFVFREKEISTSKICIDGENIYLSSVSEWKKAYTAMNRIDKISLLN